MAVGHRPRRRARIAAAAAGGYRRCHIGTALLLLLLAGRSRSTTTADAAFALSRCLASTARAVTTTAAASRFLAPAVACGRSRSSRVRHPWPLRLVSAKDAPDLPAEGLGKNVDGTASAALPTDSANTTASANATTTTNKDKTGLVPTTAVVLEELQDGVDGTNASTTNALQTSANASTTARSTTTTPSSTATSSSSTAAAPATPAPPMAAPPPASSPPTTMQETTKTRDENVSFLQALGAISGRGEFLDAAAGGLLPPHNHGAPQRQSADAVLRALEAQNPTPRPARSDLLCGTWALVYASTPHLFRSSPFFLAGRAACRTASEAARYDWFCGAHRAALAVSQLGAIRQIVTPSRLVSEVEIRAGAVPFLADLTPLRYSGGLPLVVTGTLVSAADIAATAAGDGWLIDLDTVDVKGSNVPGLRQILDTGRVRLDTRRLSNALEQAFASYATPRPLVRTTYLDEQYRISRDQDDHAYFYVKTSDSQRPTDYRSVDADLGVARLLEGFNDAVTKFYL